MPTIGELMRILQFGDSTLPVGSFSFSNGLEAAVQQKVVHDLDSLRQFVRTAAQQAARSDGIAVLDAFRAARENDLDRVQQADWAVFNRKLNEESRTMNVRMGRKLAELFDHLSPDMLVSRWLGSIVEGTTPGTYPVAQSLTFAALQLTERDAFAVHQYGLASLMLGASLRLLRLNYIDVQGVLLAINGEADLAYERVVNYTLDDMASFAPTFDVLTAIHVRSTVRLFMN